MAVEPLRLMAVHAHPDDESSKGAASTARYAAEGADVLVVSCTGGERGDVLNPRMKDDPHVLRDMVQVRRAEMDAAAAELGVRHAWLGFVDSGLPEGDPLPPLPEGCFALEPLEAASAPLVALVRRFRPHVITTYDENGGYPHPDHVMCHRVSVEAFEAAGDAARYPEAGEPWAPLKLYYHAWARARMVAFHEHLLSLGMESHFGEWLERRDAMAERTITTSVECADHFGARDRALLAHATQIDPDGFWFSLPREDEARLWSTEDFELARTRLPEPTGPGLEDDLFAGVREHLGAARA